MSCHIRTTLLPMVEYLISHRLQTPIIIYILGLDSKPMALTNVQANPRNSFPSLCTPMTTHQRCLPIRHPWSLPQSKGLWGCEEALESAPNSYLLLVLSGCTLEFACNQSYTGTGVVLWPIPSPAAEVRMHFHRENMWREDPGSWPWKRSGRRG